MPTAAVYARRKAARAARATAKPTESTTAQREPPPELQELPQVGELLPTITDIEQVMLGVNEPTVETMSAAEVTTEGGGTTIFDGSVLGPLSAWSTPEATKRGKNFVRHEQAFGGRRTTLYDYLGNDVRVLQEDVPSNIDPSIPAENRRYLRCPRCQKLPNRGIHKQAGPNGCPAREPRLMTYCDVCASTGTKTIIYEDHEPAARLDGAPLDTSDPFYRPPKTPSNQSREAGLQMKLDDHIRAFHINTARRRGLRKD